MVIARLVLLKKTDLFNAYVPPKGISVSWRPPTAGASVIEPDMIIAVFIAPERTVYPAQRFTIAKLEKELKDNRCFTIVDLNPSPGLWPDDLKAMVLDHEEEVPYDDPRLPQEWKEELDESRIFEKWVESDAIDNLNSMYDELGLEIIVPLEYSTFQDKETGKARNLYKIKYLMLPDLLSSKNW